MNLNISESIVVGIFILIAAFIIIKTIAPGDEEPVIYRTISSPDDGGNHTYMDPVVAGSFYPKDPSKLRDQIDGFLSDAQVVTDVYGIRGIVSPHAGYVYSGLTAARGYRQIQMSRYETVIVLAPSHKHYLNKASIADVEFVRTPLGDIRVSKKAKIMLADDIFIDEPKAHAQEHSLEVQLPFLQRVLPPFDVIPIVVGDVDPKVLADALFPYIDADTLIIASSDLSHYKAYEECKKADKITVDAIASIDIDKMKRDGDACGKIPILTLMHIAKKMGWRTRVFDLRNSGDTAGDKKSVVGYTSIGFYDGLDPKEQQALLDLSQRTLESHFSGKAVDVDESALPPKLLEEKACFVTLNKRGGLRGCIGHLSARMKLYRCVIDNTLNAALHDSRFSPVKEDEITQIRIEISVLSEPRPLPYESPDELLEKLIPGIDGVIIKSGYKQSTYLPVVWDQLPDKEEFLNRLCTKGGNRQDCWKLQGTEVLTYQAQEFHQDGFK